MAKKLGLGDRQTIPVEVLRQELPDLVRLKVTRQKPSSVVITVRGKKGPARKLAAAPESASEGAVFWMLNDGRRSRFKISIIRPRPLQGLRVARLDPPLEAGALRLGRWLRNQLIQLPQDPKAKHGAGWYRVKEFSESGIIVLPENALPTEIARRMMLGKPPAITERRLGKIELRNYFALTSEDS